MADQHGQERRRAEELITRLERDLDDIETGEFVQGMTDEELREKGFVGDKDIAIQRARHREGTEREQLVFEPEVEFERLADTTQWHELTIEQLLYVKDMEPGGLVATRNADEHMEFGAGHNVRKEVKGNTEHYYASCRGKVLIYQNALHVFPSDIDSTVEVSISPDKMQATMSCSPAYGEGAALTAELVTAKLKAAGVKYGIDSEAIEKAVAEANRSQAAQRDVVAAAGTPPLPGENGRVEYSFDTETDSYDFKILPDGRIDYRNTSSIIMAEQGQLLATLLPPQPGIVGVNLFNETVSAEKGKPAALTAGRGVEVSEDGSHYTATLNGSIMLNGSLLEVVNTYVVDSDVDYSTGNIEFNGNVVINGTVVQGFEVKADGDIIVARNVESARLEAGRDVVIRGGAQGRGKGLVSAGRDIRLGYAQNARLEAQGNIYIDNFAVNSYVFTSKLLKMQEKRGVVIGGEVYAQRGVEVKELGSENGIKTYVEAGTDFLVKRTIAELENVVEICDRNIGKIEGTLKAVSKAVRSGQQLPAQKKLLVKKALEKKNELLQRRTAVMTKRNDLAERAMEKDVCFVRVRKRCHTDVVLRIRDAKMTVTEPRDNVRFYEDRQNGEVGVGAY